MTYRIQKVSDKLEVPRSTIRYWEKEFPQLVNPKRTNGGQRRYSKQDISNLHKIKNLLHHKNRTIDQARIILKQGNIDAGKIDWQNQSILLTGGTGSFYKPAGYSLYRADHSWFPDWRWFCQILPTFNDNVCIYQDIFHFSLLRFSNGDYCFIFPLLSNLPQAPHYCQRCCETARRNTGWLLVNLIV